MTLFFILLRILLQDVENFQFEISELRNMGIEAESKRQADIQALHDAAGGMVETMRDILKTCQQATQESSDKKSEVAGFEASLTKAENAIESMPECTDTTQGARQLSQLEGIRHDIVRGQNRFLSSLLIWYLSDPCISSNSKGLPRSTVD